MTNIYHHTFRELNDFSLSDVKEVSGKIVEAGLNIDSCGVKHKLTLKSPKVPSSPSTTLRDLFSDLTPESVDSFKVFGEQYDSDVLWRIEIWKDDTLKYRDCSKPTGKLLGLNMVVFMRKRSFVGKTRRSGRLWPETPNNKKQMCT